MWKRAGCLLSPCGHGLLRCCGTQRSTLDRSRPLRRRSSGCERFDVAFAGALSFAGSGKPVAVMDGSIAISSILLVPFPNGLSDSIFQAICKIKKLLRVARTQARHWPAQSPPQTPPLCHLSRGQTDTTDTQDVYLDNEHGMSHYPCGVPLSPKGSEHQ